MPNLNDVYDTQTLCMSSQQNCSVMQRKCKAYISVTHQYSHSGDNVILCISYDFESTFRLLNRKIPAALVVFVVGVTFGVRQALVRFLTPGILRNSWN